MRQVKQIINMGNGALSEAQCYKLIKRLEEGFSILSALQQPDHTVDKPNQQYNQQERAKLESELKDIIFDIVTALGGNIE